MKRVMVLAMAAILCVAFAMVAYAVDAPSEPVKMDATKKPVMFNHATHTDYKCGECHHPVDGKENYKKCATAGCHSAAKADKRKAGSYYKIVHNKKVGKSGIATCVSCHKKVAGKDKAKKKALTGCKKSKCHS
ncbi:cytochrome c3 family protein [Halodesulfovibrio sp. MK-HDV]|jgi:class III cytochrome C family protein|uniref:cytochrome c3 family protein n=1 Tax=unclassified Halodesulfovibrio TaxID=2644657 RepID=UPI00136FE783|nr:cytochrome c3 family protein [Halodesulfovibrio sp. MK-HDV]KAF1076507.1 Cytochrome c3 [Halodesulfovibrio sp. MK-HDV]